MIEQAKLKLGSHHRLLEIKSDVMQIVSLSNTLKHKLNHQNIHYLELGEIIERGINSFLHISQCEIADTNETIPVSDDFLQLKKMLSLIVNYCECENNTNKLGANLDLVSDKIYITVDHKYFTKALEYIIKKLCVAAHGARVLAIEAEKNYNQTLLLKFTYKDAEFDFLNKIGRSEFVKEVMLLHGIHLDVRRLKGKDALVMRIPAYRIYYKD